MPEARTFAHFTWTRRRHVFAKAEELSITVRGNTAITTCPQETHIVFDENFPPVRHPERWAAASSHHCSRNEQEGSGPAAG